MKKSEKILLSLFLTALLIGGTGVLTQFFLNKGSTLAKERHQLELEQIKTGYLLSEKDRWLSQAQWIEQNQPEFVSEEAAAKSLIELAENAWKHGLDVTQTELLEIEDLTYASAAGMKLKISGSLEGLSQYLHESQQATAFRSITDFSIKPNPKDPAIVECQFTLLSLYKPRV